VSRHPAPESRWRQKRGPLRQF